MSRIDGITNPGPAPDLASLMPAVGKSKPSQAVRDCKKGILLRQGAGLAAGGLALFLMFNGLVWGFFVLLPAGFLLFGEASGKAVIDQQISRATSVWKDSIEVWNRNAGAGRFNEKKSDLAQAAASYRALPGVEQDMFMRSRTRNGISRCRSTWRLIRSTEHASTASEIAGSLRSDHSA